MAVVFERNTSDKNDRTFERSVNLSMLLMSFRYSFFCIGKVDGYEAVSGNGSTKKNAKQEAARKILEIIRKRDLATHDSTIKKRVCLPYSGRLRDKSLPEEPCPVATVQPTVASCSDVSVCLPRKRPFSDCSNSEAGTHFSTFTVSDREGRKLTSNKERRTAAWWDISPIPQLPDDPLPLQDPDSDHEPEALDIGLCEPVAYDQRWFGDEDINSKSVSSNLKRLEIWSCKAGFRFQIHSLSDRLHFLVLSTSPAPIVCHGYDYEHAASNAIKFGKLFKLI